MSSPFNRPPRDPKKVAEALAKVSPMAARQYEEHIEVRDKTEKSELGISAKSGKME